MVNKALVEKYSKEIINIAEKPKYFETALERLREVARMVIANEITLDDLAEIVRAVTKSTLEDSDISLALASVLDGNTILKLAGILLPIELASAIEEKTINNMIAVLFREDSLGKSLLSTFFSNGKSFPILVELLIDIMRPTLLVRKTGFTTRECLVFGNAFFDFFGLLAKDLTNVPSDILEVTSVIYATLEKTKDKFREKFNFDKYFEVSFNSKELKNQIKSEPTQPVNELFTYLVVIFFSVRLLRSTFNVLERNLSKEMGRSSKPEMKAFNDLLGRITNICIKSIYSLSNQKSQEDLDPSIKKSKFLSTLFKEEPEDELEHISAEKREAFFKLFAKLSVYEQVLSQFSNAKDEQLTETLTNPPEALDKEVIMKLFTDLSWAKELQNVEQKKTPSPLISNSLHQSPTQTRKSDQEQKFEDKHLRQHGQGRG